MKYTVYGISLDGRWLCMGTDDMGYSYDSYEDVVRPQFITFPEAAIHKYGYRELAAPIEVSETQLQELATKLHKRQS